MHGIVSDAGTGEHKGGCLLQVADPEAAFGTENLSTNVIAIDSIAAHINITDGIVGETQIDHRVIDIAHILQLREGQAGTFAVNPGDFATHQPASQVEIMHTHIDDQSTVFSRLANPGWCVLGRGWWL